MPMMEPHAQRFPSLINSPEILETPLHNATQGSAAGFLPSARQELTHRPGRLKPATTALMLQLCALMITFTLWVAASQSLPLLDHMYALAVVQGSMALLLASLFRMAVWWRVIQFMFPIGLLAMQQLALPSWVYLVGFIFTLSLFWTTFRTQVPFYPSQPEVWRRLENHLPKDRSIHLIDIGSGLGDLVMHLARVNPHGSFYGIEIAPLPWLISVCRKKLRGDDNAGFTLGNYHALDFTQFDVVFAYLSPAAMEALWHKASSEMKPGSLLMSYEFAIPGVEPDDVLASEGKPPIYVWHF